MQDSTIEIDLKIAALKLAKGLIDDEINKLNAIREKILCAELQSSTILPATPVSEAAQQASPPPKPILKISASALQTPVPSSTINPTPAPAQTPSKNDAITPYSPALINFMTAFGLKFEEKTAEDTAQIAAQKKNVQNNAGKKELWFCLSLRKSSNVKTTRLLIIRRNILALRY